MADDDRDADDPGRANMYLVGAERLDCLRCGAEQAVRCSHCFGHFCSGHAPRQHNREPICLLCEREVGANPYPNPGFLTHTISYDEIRKGDHLYFMRKLHAYSHHVIVVAVPTQDEVLASPDNIMVVHVVADKRTGSQGEIKCTTLAEAADGDIPRRVHWGATFMQSVHKLQMCYRREHPVAVETTVIRALTLVNTVFTYDVGSRNCETFCDTCKQSSDADYLRWCKLTQRHEQGGVSVVGGSPGKPAVVEVQPPSGIGKPGEALPPARRYVVGVAEGSDDEKEGEGKAFRKLSPQAAVRANVADVVLVDIPAVGADMCADEYIEAVLDGIIHAGFILVPISTGVLEFGAEHLIVSRGWDEKTVRVTLLIFKVLAVGVTIGVIAACHGFPLLLSFGGLGKAVAKCCGLRIIKVLSRRCKRYWKSFCGFVKKCCGFVKEFFAHSYALLSPA